MVFHTKYNAYFGENLKVFTATDFIGELLQHVPAKGLHLIRRYGTGRPPSTPSALRALPPYGPFRPTGSRPWSRPWSRL